MRVLCSFFVSRPRSAPRGTTSATAVQHEYLAITKINPGFFGDRIRGKVRMRVEAEAGKSVDVEDMPRLEGSNAEGFVEAQRTMTGVWLFEESWLEQGKGTVEGLYRWVSPGMGLLIPRMNVACTAGCSWFFLPFLLPPRVRVLSLSLSRSFVWCNHALLVHVSPLHWAASMVPCMACTFLPAGLNVFMFFH